MPLVTSADIVATINDALVAKSQDLEVFTEFPADELTTSEGLYVARFYSEGRQKNSLALGTSGSVYDKVDRLELYLIQGQLNIHTDEFLNTITDLIDSPIFVGYFKREFTIEQLYRKNSECYRVIFSLTQLQIIP
jgi:hypothetical protein